MPRDETAPSCTELAGTSSAPSTAGGPIWRPIGNCSTNPCSKTRGVLRVAAGCGTSDDARAVGRLISRYANVPMSYADACLVRIVETTAHASIMTLDRDFRIYRPANRRVIPLLIPR